LKASLAIVVGDPITFAPMWCAVGIGVGGYGQHISVRAVAHDFARTIEYGTDDRTPSPAIPRPRGCRIVGVGRQRSRQLDRTRRIGCWPVEDDAINTPRSAAVFGMALVCFPTTRSIMRASGMAAAPQSPPEPFGQSPARSSIHTRSPPIENRRRISSRASERRSIKSARSTALIASRVCLWKIVVFADRAFT